MPRSSTLRVDRRAFLTCLGAGLAGISILGCDSPSAPGKIGQRVERGGIALEVKQVVRRTVFSRYNTTTQAQPDRTIVLVRMTVKNVSAPRFLVPPGAFTLMSAEGRIFKPLSIGFHVPELSNTALTPGGTSSEPAVFEVPSASGSLMLTFQPTGPSEVINFEIPPLAELPTEREP